MIGSGRPSAMGAVLTCVAALALWGCGHDGSASAALGTNPPEQMPTVQGTVMAPNGQFAAATARWWAFSNALQLVSRAEASLSNVLMPIQSVEVMSLSRVLSEDAAHGSTQHSLPLVTDARTDEDGQFSITHSALLHLEDECGLMVQVGTDDPLNPNGNLLTRAFVLQHSGNDIDAVSEAVVRVVLNRLQSSTTQLCQFTVKDLRDLSTKARTAAFSATGNSVVEVNDNVYALVANNPKVQAALDAIAPQ